MCVFFFLNTGTKKIKTRQTAVRLLFSRCRQTAPYSAEEEGTPCVYGNLLTLLFPSLFFFLIFFFPYSLSVVFRTRPYYIRIDNFFNIPGESMWRCSQQHRAFVYKSRRRLGLTNKKKKKKTDRNLVYMYTRARARAQGRYRSDIIFL